MGVRIIQREVTIVIEDNALFEVDALRYGYHDFVPWEVGGMLLQWVGKGARVLDVGCGVGVLSLKMATDCQAIVTAIEPNKSRADAARRAGVDVYGGLLEKGRTDIGNCFDVIVFADVLEHIPDPRQTLVTAADYLTEDGQILASIPNVAHWTVRWDLLRGRFDYASCGIMDSTHLRWFTKKTAVELFESAGYEVCDYNVTAGTALPEYRLRRFFRRLSCQKRSKLVRSCVRFWPQLFGCQHVIRARRRASSY